jgi:endonuclease/exonuclease/phosphatase family metal-dependent hydrolase
MADQLPASLTLATFNVHMGVDGWGRPYDIVGECAALGADILVMQESWEPDDGSPSTAGRVAAQLGYEVVEEVGLARGRLYAPLPTTTKRWGPLASQVRKTLRLDRERYRPAAGPPDRAFARGHWGVALLSRLPVRDVEVIHLGRLKRDPADRAVVRGTVDLRGGELTLCGTHMAHITHGSHAQYRRLSKQLPPVDMAAVLAGDMNLWGPPTSSYFRGWRRAVTGRSWPAHRPHSQLDHVLVTQSVAVGDGRIGGFAGSDHRPVVVTLSLAPPQPEPGPRRGRDRARKGVPQRGSVGS